MVLGYNIPKRKCAREELLDDISNLNFNKLHLKHSPKLHVQDYRTSKLIDLFSAKLISLLNKFSVNSVTCSTFNIF